MKKGELMSQPFIFIFALVLGALILALGTYWIFGVVGQSNEVQTIDAVMDIEELVDTYYAFGEGSTKLWTLSYPAEVEALCFYDESSVIDCKLDGVSCDVEELYDGFSLLLGSANLYLLPLDLDYGSISYTLDHMKPDGGNPVCVSNGKDIMLTTYDDYVGISYAG